MRSFSSENRPCQANAGGLHRNGSLEDKKLMGCETLYFLVGIK